MRLLLTCSFTLTQFSTNIQVPSKGRTAFILELFFFFEKQDHLVVNTETVFLLSITVEQMNPHKFQMKACVS